MYSTQLTVTLDKSWPDRSDLTLSVECVGENVSACDLFSDVEGPVWTGTLTYATPLMQATVSHGGETVAAMTFEPDFVVVEHPNGRQCGGPRSAQVSLSPPE